MAWFGIAGGTLRSPSRSSLKQISVVASRSPVSARKAVRTMVVRNTSWNVPMWGRPEAP